MGGGWGGHFFHLKKQSHQGLELPRQLKKEAGKVNVVVKGSAWEFSNSEKIGKGKY